MYLSDVAPLLQLDLDAARRMLRAAGCAVTIGGRVRVVIARVREHLPELYEELYSRSLSQKRGF
jgi:hypothetical protein